MVACQAMFHSKNTSHTHVCVYVCTCFEYFIFPKREQDAATYQLLYQLKILTTAVFSVVLLGKQLAPRQWASLCVLCLGVGLVQASAISNSSSNSLGSTDATAAEETKRSNSLLGLLAVAAACCSSGLAGVYFEMVLKNAKTSLWVRNCQLSVFGAILGLLPVAKDWSAMYGPGGQGFLHGYNHIVWCVVLLQAGGGLLVALVVKYADSILKGFATSLSIVISCIASYFLFDFVVTPRFVLGGSLVLYSVYVYGSSDAGSRSSQTSAAPTNGSSTGSGSSSSNSSNGSSSFDKGIEVAPSPTSMDSDYNNNSNSNSSHSAESQHGSLLQRPVSTQQVSNVSSRTRAPSKDYDKGT